MKNTPKEPVTEIERYEKSVPRPKSPTYTSSSFVLRQLQHKYDNLAKGPEVGVLRSNHRDLWATGEYTSTELHIVDLS